MHLKRNAKNFRLQKAKVSPTTIQNLRSGNAESVKYKTLSNIMQKLGYALQPVKMATL